MSFELSPNIGAEIVAKARETGVSAESYLIQLVRQSEEIEGAPQETGFRSESGSSEMARAKISLGIQQLERGEVVDGEQFMMELMESVDGAGRQRRAAR